MNSIEALIVERHIAMADGYDYYDGDFRAEFGYATRDLISDSDSPIHIKKGDAVMDLGFEPDEPLMETLRYGLRGLSGFFTEFHALEETERPKFFYGSTNEKMARFAVNRLGFQMVKGSAFKRSVHEVIGKIDTVEEHFELLKARSTKGATFEGYLNDRHDLKVRRSEEMLRAMMPYIDEAIQRLNTSR